MFKAILTTWSPPNQRQWSRGGNLEIIAIVTFGKEERASGENYEYITEEDADMICVMDLAGEFGKKPTGAGARSAILNTTAVDYTT